MTSQAELFPVWIPMTNMARFEPSGNVYTSGDGVYVVDDFGRRFFDGTSGLWNVHLGHGHPHLIAALMKQAETLAYSPTFRSRTTDTTVDLARRLLEIGPIDDGRVFFSGSGSSAIETALKVVRRYHRLVDQPGRDTVISLKESYHGAVYESMRLSGQELDDGEYLAQGAPIVHVDHRDPASLSEAFAANEGRVAAVFVEPVIGNNADALTTEFVARLHEHASQTGALIVVDEVATGFGRTGTMFACEQVGLHPDIVVMSKGITSGYLPLAATVVGRRVVEAFDAADVTFLHGETQSGNPVACAVALATIEVLSAPGFLQEVAVKATYLVQRIAELEDPCIVEVAGLGLMRSIRLVDSIGAPLGPAQVNCLVDAVRDEGVLVYPSAGGLGLFPPLISEYSDLDTLVEAIGAAIIKAVV